MNAPVSALAHVDPYTLSLDQIDVSNPYLYQDDTWRPWFERLRREDPVHKTENGMYGAYWSITRYKDILAVDSNHEAFSSDAYMGGIVLRDLPVDMRRPSFISMDPPKHDEQRKVVGPIVAPGNLANMETLIRERTRLVLDSLPRNETFDWVEEVSIKLTTMMLATLFDFPFEERSKLTYWSDVAVANPQDPDGPVKSEEERTAILKEMAGAMGALFQERAKQPPKFDLLSMLAHADATKSMPPMEFIGNLVLLIVGGNDTTRNSMTGGLMALNQFPDEYRKLHANPALVETLVPEIIRYVTPVIHMRRTARQDTEIGGKTIKAGEKVIMWYISGNRDDEVIERPNEFIIDRARPRQHLSFGFGIHRCVGNRLAELQLKILWEEILTRFPMIEVMGDATRVYSCFIHGIRSLPVRIPG